MIGNKTAFVQNALPGELVEATILRKRAGVLEAIADRVISNPSTDRVNPTCPHFNLCGGCTLQHLSLDKQLSLKTAHVLDRLEHETKRRPRDVLPSMQSKPDGYRRRARVSVKYIKRKEELVIGFREKDGRFVARLSSCDILDPRLASAVFAIKPTLESLSVRESIPQLEVCAGDEQIALVVRHLKPLAEADIALLYEFAQTNEVILYLQPKGPKSLKLLWPEGIKASLSYAIAEFDVTLEFGPLSFIQVNAKINQEMIKLAHTLLKPTKEDTLLDLFCGLGNFSLPLSRSYQYVHGVEGESLAVMQAISNASLNAIENVSFETLDLNGEIAHLLSKRYTHWLIDPPRAGAKSLLEQIPTMGPLKILYISCQPATLSRDAAILIEKGYIMDSICVMNMFPHTAHIESMVLFIKES